MDPETLDARRQNRASDSFMLNYTKNLITPCLLAFRFTLLRSGAIAALALLLPFGCAVANEIVAPGLWTAAEGNDAVAYPFLSGGYYRLQQVISAEEFSSVPGPLLISGMAFREHTGGFGFAAFLTNQISFSTTPKQPDSLSPVFVENVGVDETIVLPGDQARAVGGGYDPGVSPQGFYTSFHFSQPFLYNPQGGNLLVEIKNYGGFYQPPGEVAGLDAVSLPGDGVSQLLGISRDSPSGIAWTGGHIIRFRYTVVPEPAPVVLLGLGLLVFAVQGYRRRQKG